MGKFTDQIKAWTEKTKGNVNASVGAIVMAVGQSLVEKSPVGDPKLWLHPAPKGYDPGTFKANWQCGVNEINYTITDDKDISGETSIVSINSQVPVLGAGLVFYLTNSLPYAIPLEYGHSSQAPEGMAGLTVAEYGSLWRRAILGVIK